MDCLLQELALPAQRQSPSPVTAKNRHRRYSGAALRSGAVEKNVRDCCLVVSTTASKRVTTAIAHPVPEPAFNIVSVEIPKKRGHVRLSSSNAKRYFSQ